MVIKFGCLLCIALYRKLSKVKNTRGSEITHEISVGTTGTG